MTSDCVADDNSEKDTLIKDPARMKMVEKPAGLHETFFQEFVVKCNDEEARRLYRLIDQAFSAHTFQQFEPLTRHTCMQ